MTDQHSTSMPSKIQRLDHFVLPAINVERAMAFYENVLGARPVHTFKRPDFSLAFLKLGENHFGLFTQSQATIPEPTDLKSYPRSSYLLSSDEYDAALKKLEAIKGGNRKQLSCDGRPGVVFPDSEGNLLEILRGEKQDATRLHHFHFDTLSIDRSQQFYCQFLGFEPFSRDSSVAALGIANGQKMFFHQVPELSKATMTMYRGRHFAFHVSDTTFHEIMDSLRRAHIEEQRDFHGEREGRDDGELAAYFPDPSGFRMQLVNHDSGFFVQKFGLSKSA